MDTAVVAVNKIMTTRAAAHVPDIYALWIVNINSWCFYRNSMFCLSTGRYI